MSAKNMNRLAAKHCVGWYEHHNETPLEILENFVAWTKQKHLKSYIEIADLLGVKPNEAQKLLYLAKLPDDNMIEKMKGLMK